MRKDKNSRASVVRHGLKATNEKVNVGRSVIGAARALDRIRTLLPDVVHTPASRKIRQDDAQRPLAASARSFRRDDPGPDRSRLRLLDPVQPRITRDEGSSCKSRPSDTRGSGGSRPFVPWCAKRS